MSNMSYCQFQNTAMDLRDCVSEIKDGSFDPESLSTDERKALLRIVAMSRKLVDLDDDGDFDAIKEGR